MSSYASIDGDTSNSLSSAKFFDVFTVTHMDDISEIQGTCNGDNCIVGCSCASGWEVTTASATSGYITVTTKAKFAYINGAKQSSPQQAKCRKVINTCKYPYFKLSKDQGDCTIGSTTEYCYQDTCCLKHKDENASVSATSAPNILNKISKDSDSCVDDKGVTRYKTICTGKLSICSSNQTEISTCTSEEYTIEGSTVKVKAQTYYNCQCNTTNGYYDTESACKSNISNAETQKCTGSTSNCYSIATCSDSSYLTNSICMNKITNSETQYCVTNSSSCYEVKTCATNAYTSKSICEGKITNSETQYCTASSSCYALSTCSSGTYTTKAACDAHKSNADYNCTLSGSCWKATNPYFTIELRTSNCKKKVTADLAKNVSGTMQKQFSATIYPENSSVILTEKGQPETGYQVIVCRADESEYINYMRIMEYGNGLSKYCFSDTPITNNAPSGCSTTDTTWNLCSAENNIYLDAGKKYILTAYCK